MFGLRTRDVEERAVQATPWGDWGGGGSQTWAGPKVDSGNAMQLLTVFGCVNLIASQISMLPVDTYDMAGDEAPQPSWLSQPVPGLDRLAWMSQILTSLLLGGNAYLRIQRGEDSRIVALPVLAPAKVTVTREQGVLAFYSGGLNLGRDVVHIKGIMLPGADVGVNPIEYARQTIGGGMAAQEYGARFFGQGATMPGVIEYPGEMPPAQAREVARAFRRQHGGTKKAHLPAVLEGGATWKTVGVTNEQAQFLETRKFTAAEIAAQLFLLDPADLGLPVEGTSLTYANLEERNIRRVQVALMPWISRVETALSSITPGRRHKVNVDALLRADLKSRYESYAIGIRSKFLVPNEAREWEDLDPIDGGDVVATIATPTPGAQNG